MSTVRATFVSTLVCCPLALASGWLGALVAGSGSDSAGGMPAPVAPAAEPEPPPARLEVAEAGDGGALRERLRALEAAVGELRVRAAAPAPRASGALASGPIGEDELLRFQQLERTVARTRQLRAGQARARLSIDRLLLDAKLAAPVTGAVDGALEAHFGDEQRLALIDRNVLDDLGREQLERQQMELRDRTLARLQQHLEPVLARAVADQLWQGGAPGRAVAGGTFTPLAKKDLDLAGSNVVPGQGRKVAR